MRPAPTARRRCTGRCSATMRRWSSCWSAPAPNVKRGQPLRRPAAGDRRRQRQRRDAEAAARRRRRPEHRPVRRRDGDHDGGAHRQGRRAEARIAHGRGGQRPGCARARPPLMWAAARNNADARSRAGRERRRSEGPHQQSRRRRRAAANDGVHQPAADRLHARCCSRSAPEASTRRGRSSMPAPTSTTRCRTARARWSSPPRTPTGRWPSLLLDRGADPNAAGAGWNALHQTVHSRRPNLGYTPGPVPTGNARQHRGRQEADCEGRRHRRPHDEERHEGRPAQPRQPARRDGVLSGGEDAPTSR